MGWTLLANPVELSDVKEVDITKGCEIEGRVGFEGNGSGEQGASQQKILLTKEHKNSRRLHFHVFCKKGIVPLSKF